MLKISLKRSWKKETYTIGELYVNGVRFSESVEDKDRGLTSSMTVADIQLKKVFGQTAIPTGTYKLILSVSPKFKKKAWGAKYGGLVPELVGVKGFSGVRIHPANYATELEGCIAPGDNKVKGGVLNSVKRYYELMDKYIFPSWTRKEEITITIV
jgi:hypothetical protein